MQSLHIFRYPAAFAALAVALALSAAPAGADEPPEPPVFDPANFVDPTLSTNPYHPTKPGLQWTRVGTTELGGRKLPFSVVSTMTDVVRTIDGVPAVAMLDQSIDAGEISQIGMDYFALDKDGNVWLMGGYSEDYENGSFTNVDDAWLGTGDEGGRVGILMPREVTMDTPSWFTVMKEEGDDPSVGKPVEIGVSKTVAFGTFDNLRGIQEGEVGAPDNEIKYYAPDIGVVLNIAQDASLHKDFFELANFVQLSPEGLDEASNLVLDLEAHAAEEEPEIFAGAASTRAGQ